jgi:GR25 family glycosyltransferase involved in LPS biosynthesis
MFTKILYINLDRRQDRNKNVLEQLKKINYNGNIERISAVDATKLNFNIIPKTLITDEGLATATSKDTPLYTYLTKGAIGCALSHKIAFEKVLYGNDEYVLILEDDMWFTDDFNNKLKNVLANLPEPKYDILWLGYHSKKNEQIINESFQVPNKLYGLFGYIINKKAASKMIDLYPITWQIDTEIPKTFPELKVYAVNEKNRLILSDTSQTSVTFGTDIQRRDMFSNTDNQMCFAESISFNKLLAAVFAIWIIYYLCNNK